MLVDANSLYIPKDLKNTLLGTSGNKVRTRKGKITGQGNEWCKHGYLTSIPETYKRVGGEDQVYQVIL